MSKDNKTAKVEGLTNNGTSMFRTFVLGLTTASFVMGAASGVMADTNKTVMHLEGSEAELVELMCLSKANTIQAKNDEVVDVGYCFNKDGKLLFSGNSLMPNQADREHIKVVQDFMDAVQPHIKNLSDDDQFDFRLTKQDFKYGKRFIQQYDEGKLENKSIYTKLKGSEHLRRGIVKAAKLAETIVKSGVSVDPVFHEVIKHQKNAEELYKMTKDTQAFEIRQKSIDEVRKNPPKRSLDSHNSTVRG